MQNIFTKIGATIILTTCFLLPTTPVEAATISLSGYAWSETVGWVSFKGSNYGVIVDSSTGALSGYAWSEHVGWLSFSPSDLTGCPTAPCTASVNLTTGALSGWAKWLNTGEFVRLSGPGYGVTYNNSTKAYSGYAWGDLNSGWMKWSGPGYSVVNDNAIPTPPAAPTNLMATAVSSSQINLSWTDNSSSEIAFKIERKTGAGGSWSEIHQTNPNVESYQNTGLSPNTLYYYRVRASNNGGDSAYSNESSATTQALTANISVDITPNAGTWTINPGNLARTGDTSVTVSPSGAGTVYTITPGATPSGYDSNPTITNSQGGGSSLTLFGGESVSFTVTYQRSFDYSLSNSGNINIQKGGGSYVAYGQNTITMALAPTSGPTQAVSLGISGLPVGVTTQYSSQTCQPNCSSSITLGVPSSVVAGTYPVTVTGSPLGKTTQFNLVVTNSPDLFVSCAKSPATGQVNQPVTWTANVTQTPSEAPYTYYWTGTNVPTSPAPSTQSFQITYSTTGTKNANVLVSDSKGNTAVCNPQGSINIGVTPIFEEF